MIPPQPRSSPQQLPSADELRAEVGRSAVLRRQMMAPRVYKTEPFSTTNAAIAAVEKNASLRSANATTSLVAQLQVQLTQARINESFDGYPFNYASSMAQVRRAGRAECARSL